MKYVAGLVAVGVGVLVLAGGVPSLAKEDGGAAPVRVTRTYEDADLRDVIKDLAVAGRLNVIVHPAVEGRVSVALADTPVLASLEQVVRASGYVLVENESGIRRVLPRTLAADEPPAEEESAGDGVGETWYRFRHLPGPLAGTRPGPNDDPSDIEAEVPIVHALRLVVRRDGGQVRYIPSQHALLVRARSETLEAVRALLAVFDRAPAAADIDDRIRTYEQLLAAARTEAAARYFAERLGALRKAAAPASGR